MADMQKKMGAALAAVTAFLQDEEAMASGREQDSPQIGSQPRLNLWAQSGRQEMMNMRTLIQMRAFDRCR